MTIITNCLKPLLITFLTTIVFYSCSTENNDNNASPIGETITIPVLDGYVYVDIPNATVECAGQTTTLDNRGYFSFTNISVNNVSAKITVLHPSLTYTNQPELVKSFVPSVNGVHLVAYIGGLLSNFGTFNNQSSGSIVSSYYYPTNILEFDSNTFVDKTTNNVITGNVIVSANLYDFTGSFGQLTTSGGVPYGEIQGSMLGLINDTEVGISIQSALIKTYFKSQNGNDVIANSGKKIKLKANGNFTIPTLPTQPIYLWYFDKAKNRWIQDEPATSIPNAIYDGYYFVETDKISNDYVFAYSFPVVKLTAKINSEFDNKPVSNSPVRINKIGDKTVMNITYTNNDGYITTYVPKDIPLELSLLSNSSIALTNTTDEDAIFKTNIGSVSSTSDIGTITATNNTVLRSTMLFNFKGTAVDCNTTALTNGIITIYDGDGYTQKTKVDSNGNFSINYTRPSSLASLIWFASKDNVRSRESTDLYVFKNWLASQEVKQNYSVGIINLCNQNTNQFIKITIDGVQNTYSYPTSNFSFTEPLSGINYGFAINQEVKLLGTPSFRLTYEGDRQKGLKSFIVGMNYNNQIANWVTVPKVTITEDEYNGSFYVSGFFDNAVVKYADNSTHTYSCEFRVKR